MVLNYLSSFRTFIDHQSNALKKAHRIDNSDDRDSRFVSEINYHWDNNLSYRFLWHLRNYVQHCGFPSVRFEIRGNEEKLVNNETVLSIYLDRNSLLTSYNRWNSVRKDLLKEPENIDIIYHIRSLHESLAKITNFIAQINIERLGDRREYLLGLVNEVIEKYPDATPIIGEYDNNGDNMKFIGVTHLPLYSLSKIQDILLSQ